MATYRFTQEQLITFLDEYCGCSFDQNGKEKTIALLDSLAEQGKLANENTTQEGRERLLELANYAAYARAWKMHDWFANFKVGDLVHEISTIWDEKRKGRLGILKRVTREHVPHEEEEGGYYDTFWYLELADGSEARWHNAKFIRVIDSTETVLKLDKP